MKPIKQIDSQAAIVLRMILYGQQDSINSLEAEDRITAQKQLDHLLYELGIEELN